ncbi:MAG: Chromate resistance protein ChrB [Candidatus Dormibacteraceae bacterium]
MLVYRMPPTPTAGRVAVWRLLKKIGAIYLQQSVCIFPDNSRLRHELEAVLKRIQESSGEYHLLPLRRLSPGEDAKLAEQFLEQTNKHYDEIIENCEVNFTKEVEFETFRRNFTYEEAEEIRIEFEKIVSWFERVRDRDWFSSEKEADARSWIERCEKMLEGFEANVYRAQEADDSSSGHRPAKGPSKPRRTATRRVAVRNLTKTEEPVGAAARPAKTLRAVTTVKSGSA